LSENGTGTVAYNRCATQIGFLTEWQLYAQKIEGDAWLGEKLDQGKIEKMSGRFPHPLRKVKCHVD
jgi:hypothetical protein